MTQSSSAKPRGMAMVAYEGFVDSVYDALLLFEAFSFNKVPRVTRRLTREEREHIRSGVVFIWDEDEAGILRWTDGRRWSSSRPCGNFIVYDELDAGTMRDSFSMGVSIAVNHHEHPHSHYHHYHHYPQHQPPPHHPMAYGHHHNRDNGSHMPGWPMGPTPGYHHQGMHHTWQHTMQNNAMIPSRFHNTARNNYPVLRGGLIKRALSINTADGRRMHLVSYYTAAEVEQKRLNIPRLDPQFEDIRIRKHLYPELICETSLNGGTTWRFAEAQGRGHAYAAGTRDSKANSTHATSSNSSPEPTKDSSDVSEIKVTTSEPSENVESNDDDVKKPEEEEEEEEAAATATMETEEDSATEIEEKSTDDKQSQDVHSDDYDAERTTASPRPTTNQVTSRSSVVPETPVNHASSYGPSRYSSYTDIKAAKAHAGTPTSNHHHHRWEANCHCRDCNQQLQQQRQLQQQQHHAPRTNPMPHAFHHQPSPPIVSRSPYLPERLSLTPSSTSSSAITSRLSSMSIERSQPWHNHHSHWKSGPYSASATPHYSHRPPPSMHPHHPYDKSQPAPLYYGAVMLLQHTGHFPNSKPHPSANGGYPPLPSPLSLQPVIQRIESSSPSRMHPYRRPVHNSSNGNSNNHGSYESPRSLSAPLNYGPRPVPSISTASPLSSSPSSSLPLMSPPSASSTSSSSSISSLPSSSPSYMVTESSSLSRYPLESSKPIMSVSSDIEMKHANAITPIPPIGYGKPLRWNNATATSHAKSTAQTTAYYI
ncbi:Gti1/Pac2 family-domain-containing protein [Syncephalis plumigaleata]|nr:Gti1/Pac2 family-domain-containing protein [Syncephalis plumigaleata]